MRRRRWRGGARGAQAWGAERANYSAEVIVVAAALATKNERRAGVGGGGGGWRKKSDEKKRNARRETKKSSRRNVLNGGGREGVNDEEVVEGGRSENEIKKKRGKIRIYEDIKKERRVFSIFDRAACKRPPIIFLFGRAPLRCMSRKTDVCWPQR